VCPRKQARSPHPPGLPLGKRRVRAHIAICYMAFRCLQHLRHRLARCPATPLARTSSGAGSTPCRSACCTERARNRNTPCPAGPRPRPGGSTGASAPDGTKPRSGSSQRERPRPGGPAGDGAPKPAAMNAETARDVVPIRNPGRRKSMAYSRKCRKSRELVGRKYRQHSRKDLAN